MKLQILVPQYKETDEIVKPLLDSIALQQNVDFNEVGVVIANDGTDIKLSDELLTAYPFKIDYIQCKHGGVSATRNACLDHSTAEYVMFCDADDMLCSVFGLWILFREIENGGFDSLTSVFMEETRISNTKTPTYIERGRADMGGIDCTFVHGKVHRRKYLLDNNIRWNNNLTIHEDSYFNCLCQKLANPNRVKYCPTPWYLWKWRDESVCRHDPKYILKTFNNMLESNTALVKEFLKRGRQQDAQFYVTSMIFDSYYTMNKDEWLNQENVDYRDNTERRFKQYYLEFKNLYEMTPIEVRNQIIVGVRNRFFQEGMMLESITFDSWIKHIMEL